MRLQRSWRKSRRHSTVVALSSRYQNGTNGNRSSYSSAKRWDSTRCWTSPSFWILSSLTGMLIPKTRKTARRRRRGYSSESMKSRYPAVERVWETISVAEAERRQGEYSSLITSGGIALTASPVRNATTLISQRVCSSIRTGTRCWMPPGPAPRHALRGGSRTAPAD